MAQVFKNGMVVRLKSGGPQMTVAGYDRYGRTATQETYKCRWFDAKNGLTENFFTEEELEEATPMVPSPVTSTGSLKSF